MSTVPDTHQHVKDLIAAGFTDMQAEALVKTQIGLSGDWATKTDIEQLRQATKTDIGELRQATKADIGELRQATKTDIAAVKADINLLRWMIGFNLAISAAILPILIFKSYSLAMAAILLLITVTTKNRITERLGYYG